MEYKSLSSEREREHLFDPRLCTNSSSQNSSRSLNVSANLDKDDYQI